ncbi:MAG: 50S ribosomal protein L25 [Vulcanimicrobiota bacterium]
MAQVKVDCKQREGTGKGVARKIRAQGRIPGVLYGRNEEPVLVELDEKNLAGLMKEHGLNLIVELAVEGGDTHTCMLADYQRDVFQRFLTHVDFKRIKLDEKVQAKVPVRMTGEAEVRTRGGMAQLYLRELNIRALPADIPKSYLLDISKMKPGQNKRLNELEFEKEVELLHDPNKRIVNILAPRGLAGAGLETEDEGEDGDNAEPAAAE